MQCFYPSVSTRSNDNPLLLKSKKGQRVELAEQIEKQPKKSVKSVSGSIFILLSQLCSVCLLKGLSREIKGQEINCNVRNYLQSIVKCLFFLLSTQNNFKLFRLYVFCSLTEICMLQLAFHVTICIRNTS